MKKGAKIPISTAKSISKQYGKDQVIIVTWENETSTTTVTTFGKTLASCEQAAEGGNFVKKALGWPNHLTEDKPARQKAKEKKLRYELLDQIRNKITLVDDVSDIKSYIDDLMNENYG
jgi:hypothetical protein